MPRRISRLGGTTLRRSFITNAYSPAICRWGPDMAPKPPLRSARPGEAVARLYFSPLFLPCQQAAMFGHHAAVLDDADAVPREGFSCGVVADAELEPHGGRPPRPAPVLGAEHRHAFGPAEHDDVTDLLIRVRPRRRRGARGDEPVRQHHARLEADVLNGADAPAPQLVDPPAHRARDDGARMARDHRHRGLVERYSPLHGAEEGRAPAADHARRHAHDGAERGGVRWQRLRDAEQRVLA